MAGPTIDREEEFPKGGIILGDPETNDGVGLYAGADSPIFLNLDTILGSKYYQTNGDTFTKTGLGGTSWTLDVKSGNTGNEEALFTECNQR